MADRDGSALPYREVLWPSGWVWLLPIGFAASLGIAYGYAYSARAGWIVAAVTVGLLLAGLGAAGGTRIQVDTTTVRAGRAQLPTHFVGRVKPLDSDEAFRARTSAADPRAYLVLRPWAASQAVIVEVTDPADPHPYWLLTTRQPQRLADALLAARADALSR